MEGFVYRSVLKTYGCLVAVLFAAYVMGLYVMGGVEQNYLEMAVLCFASIGFFLWGRHYGTYAEFDQDGIHICSRKHVKLAMVPWTEICFCKSCYCHKTFSTLFLRSNNAKSKGKYLLLEDCPYLKEKYRVEYQMEKLARGRITAVEFLDQDYYCFTLSNKQIKQAKGLWRSAAPFTGAAP